MLLNVLQVYARSGSPLTAVPTTSNQLPAVGTTRPSLSYVPPVVQTGANSGLFQKRHGQRLPHATAVRGISRVQSMPAHNSQQYLTNVSFLIFEFLSVFGSKFQFYWGKSATRKRLLAHISQRRIDSFKIFRNSQCFYTFLGGAFHALFNGFFNKAFAVISWYTISCLCETATSLRACRLAGNFTFLLYVQ